MLVLVVVIVVRSSRNEESMKLGLINAHKIFEPDKNIHILSGLGLNYFPYEPPHARYIIFVNNWWGIV